MQCRCELVQLATRKAETGETDTEERERDRFRHCSRRIRAARQSKALQDTML